MAAQQRDRNGSGAGENNDRRERRSGRGNDRDNRRNNENKNEYIERVVTINRVSKVVKGGRRFSFTALVVVGDGEGTVGVGYGKAKEVPQAISKGVEEAKKNFFRVPMIRRTITHVVQGRDTAGIVLLRPAAPVPALSPAARCAPSWRPRASTTCSPSRWVRPTRSTSSTRRLTR